MFSLPTLIRNPSGDWKFRNGAIIKLPIELCDHYRIETYKKISSAGWGVSEFNYNFYAAHTADGGFLIIPGLFVKDKTKPSKRFYGYAASVTQDQVEQTVAGTVAYLAQTIEDAQRDLSMLVHDLRALSNAIYSPAEEAIIQIDRGNVIEARKRVETVIAAQGILKMRTDALDFAGNVLNASSMTDVQVYRKIDKVQRCFKSMAIKQGKSVTLRGSSFRKVRGRDVFELIPYLIIDNAVKYSPAGYDISVDVADQSKETVLRIKSFGPKILEEERSSIFEPRVRGSAAVDSKIPGTGIGLDMAKRITEQVFGGTIECEQTENKIDVDGMNYFETHFVVTVPTFL